MNEEDAKTGTELLVNTGRVIANAAALELVCMAWAQALSTDPHAIAILFGERVELPAIRRLIIRLAGTRKPALLDRLAPLLKQAEQHAEFRNVVAHNPQLFSVANEPVSLSNLRKPTVVTDPNDLPGRGRAIGETAHALVVLYIDVFGKAPSYDNVSSPHFAPGAGDDH